MLILVGFAPAKSLINFERVDSPLELPNETFFGSSLVFEIPQNVSNIQVDGTPITKLTSPTVASDKSYGFIGVGIYNRDPITITGLINIPKNQFFSKTVILKRKDFGPEANLRLPTTVWKKVSKKNDPTKKIYRAKMKEYAKIKDGTLRDVCWQSPLISTINSPFGKPRILPNGHRYYHTGVDLRSRRPQEIRAPASGKVLHSHHETVQGNTVLIHHGGGIQSQYMHLSQKMVSEGDLVKKGQILGLTGSTGRVEGPHLHWEVHWKGRKISPLDFVDAIGFDCSLDKT